MSRMSNDQANQGESATANLRDTASQVGQQLRDVGSQVKDAAREQYNNLRDQASGYYDQGRQMVEQYTDSLEQYVQEQPIKSILIAAGVGVLLGILWKRS